VRAELLRELQQLACITGQARELREHEAGDPAAAHVSEHALSFGVRHDRLPAHGVEAIHLHHVPALGFGVCMGALLVMLRAFAAHLIFG
jgi:hypothetical protein